MMIVMVMVMIMMLLLLTKIDLVSAAVIEVLSP
jgi:hypothetical protein